MHKQTAFRPCLRNTPSNYTLVAEINYTQGLANVHSPYFSVEFLGTMRKHCHVHCHCYLSGRDGTQKRGTSNCKHSFSKQPSPNTKANNRQLHWDAMRANQNDYRITNSLAEAIATKTSIPRVHNPPITYERTQSTTQGSNGGIKRVPEKPCRGLGAPLGTIRRGNVTCLASRRRRQSRAGGSQSRRSAQHLISLSLYIYIYICIERE